MGSFLRPDPDQPSTLSRLLARTSVQTTSRVDDSAEDPDRILSPGERRAAMSSLSAKEAKWSKFALLGAAVFGVCFTIYLTARHSTKTVTEMHNGHPLLRHGHKVTHQVPLSQSWELVGVAVLVFCVVGAFALQRRKRTLLAFSFFVIGFAFTLMIAPLGLAFIVMGGWLMLRAHRIQKYGTTNTRLIARGAPRTPRRSGRAQKVPTGTTQAPPRAATASKRYTPKAAPRKGAVKAKPVK